MAWGENDLVFNGSPVSGAPSADSLGGGVAATAAAVDPNAGAGWKQGVSKAIQDGIGDAKVVDGQFRQSTDKNPIADAAGKAAGGMAGGAANALLQRAKSLLSQGVISADQYNRMVGQIGPGDPTERMAGPNGGYRSGGYQPDGTYRPGEFYANGQSQTAGAPGRPPVSPAWGGMGW